MVPQPGSSPSQPEDIRACNDERTDRDFQLDGGGVSDKPVIVVLHPSAQVRGATVPPVFVMREKKEGLLSAMPEKAGGMEAVVASLVFA